jgi:tRNA nucleotidyltransferase (CCA-adding enzyme)
VAAHPLVERVRGLLEGEVSAVGGVVRDALLGAPPGPELDLVVEGDAIALAEHLGHALGARVAAHPRFGTATIELPHHDGHLDLVSARTERYAVPGALPIVAPGTLADDLARRDFTINAMALRLAGATEGELVDPHGGVADLGARLVRALRDDAFGEDPSRLVRAARYAARLGFALEPGTERAARAAAPALDPGSARVADELRRLLEGPEAATGLRLLRGLGVGWIQPGLAARFGAIDAALAAAGAPDIPAWPLRMGLALAQDALARAHVPGWARGLAAEVARGPELSAQLAGATRPSEVDRVLRAAPAATAVGALALGAYAVAGWWAGDRDREPDIRGADLVRAGVRPGPAIGRALAEVRAAVLDGLVGGRDEQLELALRAAAAGR